MKAPEIKTNTVEIVDVTKIRPHPKNARKGSSGKIATLIRANGFVGALVVQRSTGFILVGNHRYAAAVDKLGMTALPVMFVDVDDEQARRILLADNAASDEATYDDRALADMLASFGSTPAGLVGTGYTSGDLDKMLKALETSTASTIETDAGDLDVIEPPPDKPKSKRGTLYKLGPHRLFVGDSLNPDDVAKLFAGVPHADVIVTDPPYAIYGSSTGVAGDIADEKMVRPFFAALFAMLAARLKVFGHFYVCCDWRSYPTIAETLKGSGLESKNMIVWDKGGSGLGSNYANTYELVAFGSRMRAVKQFTSRAGKKSGRTGVREVFDANVWRINRALRDEESGERRAHNAQKPLALVERAILNSTDEGDVVFDAFGGSGTTLLGAARTGRIGLAMEIEPKFADVIRRRWGNYARKIGIDPGADAL